MASNINDGKVRVRCASKLHISRDCYVHSAADSQYEPNVGNPTPKLLSSKHTPNGKFGLLTVQCHCESMIGMLHLGIHLLSEADASSLIEDTSLTHS